MWNLEVHSSSRSHADIYLTEKRNMIAWIEVNHWHSKVEASYRDAKMRWLLEIDETQNYNVQIELACTRLDLPLIIAGRHYFLRLLLFCVGLAVEVREEDEEDGGVAHEEERQGLGQLAVVGEEPNHVGNHETELDLKRCKHETRAEKFGA